jgi:hypothetical protein
LIGRRSEAGRQIVAMYRRETGLEDRGTVKKGGRDGGERQEGGERQRGGERQGEGEGER